MVGRAQLQAELAEAARRREGSYLLRSNVAAGDPARLWTFYLQLLEVEQAFKELKGGAGDPPDLSSSR